MLILSRCERRFSASAPRYIFFQEDFKMNKTLTSHRGISDFGLKYLAMFLMILDHIEYFFEFTGKVPLFFTWLGRISAPLFLFCLIEGFVHTHDRWKYFLRIYVIAIGMGLIQFSFYNIGRGLVRPDGFFPQNQMLASFSILLVVLQGLDWCRQKKWLPGLCAVILPIILPFLAIPLFTNPKTGFLANFLCFSILPLHSFIMDGGTGILLMGIVLYLFHKHPKRQAIAFVIMVILFDIVRLILMVPSLTFVDFFTEAYQWMEIFAVIPMLCYNGQRGKGSKKLFYWFYPVHIYVLYALSFFLYPLIH